MSSSPVTVLFTGYAPVHFDCFKPIYDRLLETPGVNLYLSGGVRTVTGDVTVYDPQAMYGPFGISTDAVLTVTEISEMDFDYLFCANTKRIEPRAAGHRVQMFHGMSFRNRGVRRSKSGTPDYYFMVGPYMQRAFRLKGLLDHHDVRSVKVGFPKTDPLVNGAPDRSAAAAGFGFDGRRPVVLFAPTGAEGNSLETIGEPLIDALQATGRYDLLIKPHDHAHGTVNWFERLATVEDKHTRLVRDPGIVSALVAADLLITDASSVANEYALLDRPIVFVDVPDLLAADLRRGALVDLDTWGRRAGVVVHHVPDAVEAVAAGLADPAHLSGVRRTMVTDLFYNPGHATEAALSWFRRHAAL